MADTPEARPSRARKVLGTALRIAAVPPVLLLAAWVPLAIFFLPWPAWIGGPAALLAAGAEAWALFRVKPRLKGRLAFAGGAAATILVWSLVPPSNQRNWQPDVAVPSTAEIDGDRIVIRGVRDSLYRSDSDYEVRRRDRTVHLSKLNSADLYVVYWGSPLIAHTMISFGFEGEGTLCFSIETRKEVGESYSALKGFFKQYELYYVVGEERDLVRVRALHRKEDVYLYRLKPRPELFREVFLDYLARMNRMATQPEWYHAVANNCTNNIVGHTRPYVEESRMNWRLLLNGRVDALAYRDGSMAAGRELPFEELKRRCRVTDRAATLEPGDDYPARLREGLPGMAP